MDVKLIKLIVGGVVGAGTLALGTLGIIGSKKKHNNLIKEDLISMDKQINESIDELTESVGPIEIEPATKTTDAVVVVTPNEVTATKAAQIYNSISEYIGTNIEVVKKFAEGRTLMNDIRLLHATLTSYGIDHSNSVTPTAEK